MKTFLKVCQNFTSLRELYFSTKSGHYFSRDFQPQVIKITSTRTYSMFNMARNITEEADETSVSVEERRVEDNEDSRRRSHIDR